MFLLSIGEWNAKGIAIRGPYSKPNKTNQKQKTTDDEVQIISTVRIRSNDCVQVR